MSKIRFIYGLPLQKGGIAADYLSVIFQARQVNDLPGLRRILAQIGRLQSLSVVRHNDPRMGDSRLRTILNSVHAERMDVSRIVLLQVHRIRPAPARAILRSGRRFGMLFLRYLATALTPVLS